ncbi:vWA domain-containing protein [Acidiluteibacter ferrifornacis]|uniref:VWA domain-containing protein n=1 Tax=Acidiluteibacter ferrifornacis TaxID=2692424 RepID=A0A6N9NGV9_9FLAO|nr:VWA domain-containing protein [Acidiluteibacter ferrifornacis]NBG65054.1 VWA domain-containing protein [Acidiluteibacter ferrifornacis]
MRAIYTFILFYIPFLTLAQDFINKTVFDLGEIEKLNQEIIDLNITNSTDSKMYLLRIDGVDNFEVKYTSKTFEVGEAQVIRFKYKPKKKGKFSENIHLYFSSNTDPTSITIKGEVLIVPKNLLQACPDFRQIATATTNSFPQEKAEIKISYVNFLDNNSFAVKSIEKPILMAKNQQEVMVQKTTPVELVPPKTITLKSPRQDSIIHIASVEPEIIIPISTPPNELSRNEFKPNNIIFLIDASMSMGKNQKLELLKASMKELLIPLREIDKIAIVSYNDEAKVVLPSTTANNKPFIEASLDSVVAGGFTSGNKGLIKAYEVAYTSFIEGGNNQIYLVTDGAFKIGEKNESIPRLIKDAAEKEIFITTVGIKNERWTEKTLKEIAKNGEGSYLRIEDFKDINALLNRIKEQSLVEKK